MRPLLTPGPQRRRLLLQEMPSRDAPYHQPPSPSRSIRPLRTAGSRSQKVAPLLAPGEADAVLLASASTGCLASISSLVRLGANVNAADKLHGMHPLLAAAQAGHLRAVKLLINFGADVNQAGLSGITALHAAASNGDTPMVRWLLHKGARSASSDSRLGETALAAAASRGAEDTVQVLLEAADAGTAAATLDSQGRTVLQLCGYPQIRAMLQAASSRGLEDGQAA